MSRCSYVFVEVEELALSLVTLGEVYPTLDFLFFNTLAIFEVLI